MRQFKGEVAEPDRLPHEKICNRKGYKTMFNFRIIICHDGTEIIDRNLKTPCNALTSRQMMEYVEMESRLDFMDRMEKQRRMESRRKQKAPGNVLYRLACICGLT